MATRQSFICSNSVLQLTLILIFTLQSLRIKQCSSGNRKCWKENCYTFHIFRLGHLYFGPSQSIQTLHCAKFYIKVRAVLRLMKSDRPVSENRKNKRNERIRHARLCRTTHYIKLNEVSNTSQNPNHWFSAFWCLRHTSDIRLFFRDTLGVYKRSKTYNKSTHIFK